MGENIQPNIYCCIVYLKEIISNRHQTVALNCPSSEYVLFHALTRLYRAQPMKETEHETQISVPASQKARQENKRQGEFLARRGFLLLFFRKKK